MKPIDFLIFKRLLSEVYFKAFSEHLSQLPHGKAQILSWMIFEQTGELLSYKSLGNYVQAILEGTPEKINPTGATLGILAGFLRSKGGEIPRSGKRSNHSFTWYQYRSGVLRCGSPLVPPTSGRGANLVPRPEVGGE